MITAAAAGIGRSVARAFAAQGAKVHVCDVNEAALDEFRQQNLDISATMVDVSSEGEIDAWFDDALEDLGGLDVLVNNAGTKGPTAPIDDIDFADWRDCLAICLDSHFLCARRAAPVMKAQGSGNIINLSSTAGLFGFGNRTPYAAAKWAVIGLTKSLAIELGPHGVRCNAICPGAVRGDRINRVIAGEAEQRGVDFAVVEKEMVSAQSIPRFVEPDEIADMCLFLSSPAAKMVNGQAIAVDGHLETMHIR
jgi:NAD(P)-dependent dehydrogenase (short-subunit alcohol dehydrogenase family)